MNLLFITHANLDQRPYGDGSTRYRCFNVAEVARRSGHNVQVLPLSRVSVKDIARFDLVSWLRPVASNKLNKLLEKARSLKVICIADLDDLIVDPTIASHSPAVINKFSTLEVVSKRFANHATAVRQFDAITVSTDYLGQVIATLFPQMPVATVRNGLSEFWLQHVDRLPSTESTTYTAGYLPGTRSHDQDFVSIQQPLMHWLNAQKRASLNIVGKLSLEKSDLPNRQVTASPWVDYFQLPYFINQHEALLAPLTQSQFNSAKSHVKFIEAAAVGVPLIASGNPDIAQHTIAGLLLADSSSEWFQSLKTIMNGDFRAAHAPGLRAYARTHCTATRYCAPLIQAWESGQYIPCPDRQDTFAAAA